MSALFSVNIVRRTRSIHQTFWSYYVRYCSGKTLAGTMDKKVEIDDQGVEVDTDEATGSTWLHGLNMNDLDRTGKVPVWCLSNMLQTGRIKTSTNPNFWMTQCFGGYLDNPRPTLFYGIWMDVSITPTFYDAVAKEYFNFKAHYNFKLKSLGKSSIIFEEFINDRLGRLMFKAETCYVCVDSTINPRRPKPHDDSVMQKYAKFVTSSTSRREPVENPPPNAYEQTIEVWHSEIDHYHHMNYCQYPRFCINVANRACSAGLLKNFNGDLAEWKVAFIRQLYMGEGNAMDKLKVKVWEEDSDINTMYFKFFLEDTVTYDAVIKFHPKDQKIGANL